MQESLKSELRLRRYGEKKLLGPICNFWKVDRVNLELFQKSGVFLKFCGPRVDFE
jgi:hypothetical protein